MNNARSITRRDLIIGGATGLVGLTSVGRSAAALAPDSSVLAFYHLHTSEKLSVTYRENGVIVDEALAEICHLLRDFRNEEQHAIDVDLLDTLSALYDQFGRRGRFEVISGYRSPATNETLRRNSTGVAKNSLHLSGQAIDVRLTGAATTKLRDAAIAMQRGGVGFYRESNFVHLDTGRVRSW